jgi:hypothetical protein
MRNLFQPAEQLIKTDLTAGHLVWIWVIGLGGGVVTGVVLDEPLGPVLWLIWAELELLRGEIRRK